jgi:hypothetical protein
MCLRLYLIFILRCGTSAELEHTRSRMLDARVAKLIQLQLSPHVLQLCFEELQEKEEYQAGVTFELFDKMLRSASNNYTANARLRIL